MGNEVITLVKDTSLAFVLGIMEMFTQAKAIAAAQTSICLLYTSPDALALTRPEQKEIPGWAAKKRARQAAEGK